MWGGEDPVGRRFRRAGDGAPEWLTVMGVIADFNHNEPERQEDPNSPAVYKFRMPSMPPPIARA